MRDNTAYRLDNYRISCCENTLYWWEKHLDIGRQRRGRCFVHKNLLIIGHDSSDEIGYLIGEFLEELQQLPVWEKTPYYCYAHELFSVVPKKNAESEILEELQTTRRQLPALGEVPGQFRLDRYRLTVTAAGEIFWQTYGEGGRLTVGPCFLESDLLCLGSQQTEEKGQTRKEFLASLNGLPPWEQTSCWCHASVLRPCGRQQKREQDAALPWQSRGWEEHSPPPRPDAAPWHQEVDREGPQKNKTEPFSKINYEDRVQQFFQAWRERLTEGWPHIPFEKVWPKYWLPLVATGLLIGLAMLVHAYEKGVPWPRWFAKQHHEHHSHKDHKEH